MAGLSRRVTAISLIALLSSCGGGGGTPSASMPPAQSPPSTPSVPPATSSPAPAPSPTVGGGSAGPTDSRVVVGVNATGVNVYNTLFHGGGPIYGSRSPSSVTPAVLAEFGIDDSRVLRLTRTGNPDADLQADRKKFEAVQLGKPYWIAGTNLIFISEDPGELPILPNEVVDNPIDDDLSTTSSFGGSAASILWSNPEAIVLVYENLPSEYDSVATDARVDVVSTFLTANRTPIDADDAALQASYDGVVKMGKLLVGVADAQTESQVTNAYSINNQNQGPFWTISVGRFEEGESNGKYLQDPNPLEFVADSNLLVPGCHHCQDGSLRYTSVVGADLGAGSAAGTLSAMILKARRAVGYQGGIRSDSDGPYLLKAGAVRITNWQLRRAAERAAAIPLPSGFNPAGVSVSLTAPVPSQSPYAEIGWGLLTTAAGTTVVDGAMAVLGLSTTPAPNKTSDFCSYMGQWMRTRITTWSSDARPTSADPANGDSRVPYLAC